MATAVEKLPDDPALLKALIRKERESFQKQLNTLIEALHLERHRRYGTRSEKAPGQGELFDEAEQDNDEVIVESDKDSAASSPKLKKTGTRKPLPKELPRVRHVHELPEEERQCDCGCTLEKIGEQISEQLDIIPASVQVIEHVRVKYACKHCEDGVKTVPRPCHLTAQIDCLCQYDGFCHHLKVRRWHTAV